METELEIKFLISESRYKEQGISDQSANLLNYAISMNRHLLVYYDNKNVLLDKGSTFRISMRKIGGIDKSRVTYKKQLENKEVRVANEYHTKINKNINCFKKEINTLDSNDFEFLSANPELPFKLERKCWILVQRYKLRIGTEYIDLDIARTNKGIYFEEIEIEEPNLSSLTIKKFAQNFPRSVLNKYQRTVKLNG